MICSGVCRLPSHPDLLAEKLQTRSILTLHLVSFQGVRSPDEDVVEYQIGSHVSDLKIVLPAALAFDRTTLDRVFAVMSELVDSNTDYEECEAQLLYRAVVSSETDERMVAIPQNNLHPSSGPTSPRLEWYLVPARP